MIFPMHIPAFLCGFVCGWPYALAVGFIAPLLRNLLFHMPPLFPTGVSMAFELATYGVVAAICYRRLPLKRVARLYVSLLISMVAGRIVWGLVRLLLAGSDRLQLHLQRLFERRAAHGGAGHRVPPDRGAAGGAGAGAGTPDRGVNRAEKLTFERLNCGIRALFSCACGRALVEYNCPKEKNGERKEKEPWKPSSPSWVS